MTDPFKVLDKDTHTEQYSKSLDIMAEFSKYHMYAGHYFNVSKMMNNLHISEAEFRNMMCGSKLVSLGRYNQILKYIDNVLSEVK